METNELIQLPKCQVSNTGLHIDPNCSFDEWWNIGQKLVRITQIAHWAIGDWINFGKKFQARDAGGRFLDSSLALRYEEAMKLTEKSYNTIQQIAWICSEIPVVNRLTTVPFWHYREVAKIPEKARPAIIQRIVDDGLTQSQVRLIGRKMAGERDAAKSDGPIASWAGSLVDKLLGWLKDMPSDFWDEDRRQIWRGRLKPIVEFYSKL